MTFYNDALLPFHTCTFNLSFHVFHYAAEAVIVLISLSLCCRDTYISVIILQTHLCYLYICHYAAEAVIVLIFLSLSCRCTYISVIMLQTHLCYLYLCHYTADALMFTDSGKVKL